MMIANLLFLLAFSQERAIEEEDFEKAEALKEPIDSAQNLIDCLQESIRLEIQKREELGRGKGEHTERTIKMIEESIKENEKYREAQVCGVLWCVVVCRLFICHLCFRRCWNKRE